MVTDDGFEIRSTGTVGGVRWDRLRRIDAFKRDLFTEDLVCLAFTQDDVAGYLEVNEDVEGFWDLVRRIKQRLPGSDQTWEQEVVQPAFARSHRVIYERASG